MKTKASTLALILFLSILFLSAQSENRYNNFNNKVAKGWNTWNYENMLSYVLLPDGLGINISFRPAVSGTPYENNYHFNKIMPTTIGNVRPQSHSYNGAYTDVIIDNWKGNKIQVQSAAVDDNLYVLFIPLQNSNTKYFVEMEAGMLWNRKGILEKNGPIIKSSIEDKQIVIRSTKTQIENARPYKTVYQSYTGDEKFAIYTGEKKSLNEIHQMINNAKQNFEKEASQYASLSEAYKATQSVLGWNTIYDADLNRVITPVARGWNEAWQGFVLFEWDTYFAALLLGLNNKEYAYSNAIAVSKGVNRFGAVAFTQQPRNQLADNSQPPVGSMVCWKLYEKYQEEWFLEEVYESLLSWNRWWEKNRKNRGYITWGASWPNANVQDGSWESGLDNSPMYEDLKMEQVGHNSLFNLADVGLNSLYVMDCQYLQKIAIALGRTEEAEEIKKREQEITEKVQSLWSEENGIYLNKYLDSGEFSERLTPTLFYPMIAQIPTKKQARRLLKEHYFNPEEFYGEYIIPSVARNDKSYDNRYWRGAIWGPMNFLVYLGLKNYNDDAAKELAQKSYDMFMVSWNKHKYILENIHAEKGPNNYEDQIDSDPYYQWGALMAIMKFMEEGKY